MLYEDNACNCGADDQINEDNACAGGCSGCDHDHDHDFGGSTIVMTDAETGEEFSFELIDDFVFQDEHYCVLVTTDLQDPEMVITRVVTMDDGSEGLVSLDDAEYDLVYAEYERLCEEYDEEEDDDQEDED